jgi:hypothetical protein
VKTKLMLHPRARRGFKCLAAAASLGALAMAVVPQNAMAATAVAAPPGMKIVAVDGAGTVAVPSNATRNMPKLQWLHKYGALKSPSMKSPSFVRSAATTVTSSGWASGPAGPQSFLTSRKSNLSTSEGLITWTEHFATNSSYSDWLGSKPFNATTVDASMSWWVSGVNVSPSLPAGAGFSSAGSGITWNPNPVNNTYYENLNYQAAVNINATHIFTGYFTDQADFLLGNSWYHVQGN